MYAKAWLVYLTLIFATALQTGCALTPKKKTLSAFIVPTPQILVETAIDKEEATELWVEDSESKRLLLRGRADSDPKKAIACMSSPMVTADGRYVYFSSSAWVTSGSIQRVCIETKKVEFVCDGDLIGIIDSGIHAGKLIAARHMIKHDKNGESLGRAAYFWLLSPEGKPELEIGAEEPESECVERFMKQNPIRRPAC